MYLMALNTTAVDNAASGKKYIITTCSSVAMFVVKLDYTLYCDQVNITYANIKDAWKYEGSDGYNI